MRLGARLNAPCEVVGWRAEHGFHVVELADGSEIPTRAVIIASGARYRRLDVEDLERFEGSGVYYAATDLEARVCRGTNVIVVGGGNSAGQAAIYLAQQGSPVSLVIRKGDLTESMSQYLISRIEADSRIEFRPHTQVRAPAGATWPRWRCSGCSWRTRCRSFARRLSAGVCSHGFIGAVPSTAWLGDSIISIAGFVLTHRSPSLPVVAPLAFAGASAAVRSPAPGVFAVGRREGSLKRVAAAVGEGSSAVRPGRLPRHPRETARQRIADAANPDTGCSAQPVSLLILPARRSWPRRACATGSTRTLAVPC
jgi:thioredoxin reductase (NADPH)